VAKKKSRSSKAPAARSGRLPVTGAVVALGLAAAGGGYFLGKGGEGAPDLSRLIALTGADKFTAPAAKPAPDQKRAAEAPRPAVKAADKAGLARLLKNDTKQADAAEPAPRPSAEIPRPPVRPDLGGAEREPEAEKENARAEPARPPETPKAETARAAPADQPAPLAFALVDREVGMLDSDKVTLSLDFENLSGKPIRAFEGVVKFMDRQDTPLYSAPISVSAMIAEGGALRWEQHVDARRLDAKGKRLVSEEKENLKAVFLLRKLFFIDGSVRKFGENGRPPARAAQAG
jgi:hypothetical protein